MAARGQPPGASASHLRALWPELRPALCSCSAPCLRVRGLPGENLPPFTGGGLPREAWDSPAMAGLQGPQACWGRRSRPRVWLGDSTGDPGRCVSPEGGEPRLQGRTACGDG